MRIYIGVDPRSPVAYNVLQWSILRRASRPVAIVPLILPTLPITRTGLTHFTFTRYLPPALSGYRGTSLFLDADMLMMGDVCELFALDDGQHSVKVVKNAQRFEWPSMMLFNNERCRTLTPEYINDDRNTPQSFAWVDENGVGELPAEWNFCVNYDKPGEDLPKLIHYTAGIPAFPECRDCDYAELWTREHESMNANCSWLELMGGSVHAGLVLSRLQKRAGR